MNTEEAFCPNPECPLHGLQDQDNIRLHSKKEKRFRCQRCMKTFAATTGTPFYRRKYEAQFISQVVSLLAHGCPVDGFDPPQAIAVTYDLDERTVYSWQAAAGRHSQALHGHLLKPMDLLHVQADEIRVKAQGKMDGDGALCDHQALVGRFCKR